MIVFLALSAAWADPPCAAPASTVDLDDSVAVAEAAFAAMNLDGFEQARSRAEAQLACLEEPIYPTDAAAFHRLEGLAAFAHEDDAGSVAAFRAALAIEPDFALPERIAPEGHPLRVRWDEAKAKGPGAAEPYAAPGEVSVRFDGKRAEARPTERPVIVQGLAESGAVVGTAWVKAGAPLPGWALAPVEAPRQRVAHGPHAPLLVATGASLAVSGGLYGLAWGSRSAFFDPDTPVEDLQGARARTNAMTVGSAVLLGAGVATGAALVVTW